MKLYVNGTIDSPSWSSGVVSQLASLTGLFIGVGVKGTIGSSGWNGTIDEFKIYNRSLTALEISELYNRSYNKYYDVQLKNDWQIIDSNKTYLKNTSVWMWTDYSCSYSNWHLFDPYFYFRQCCEDCICSEEV